MALPFASSSVALAGTAQPIPRPKHALKTVGRNESALIIPRHSRDEKTKPAAVFCVVHSLRQLGSCDASGVGANAMSRHGFNAYGQIAR